MIEDTLLRDLRHNAIINMKKAGFNGMFVE